ncbi:TonB-dependent receptor [Paenochrobactrum glaciei]
MNSRFAMPRCGHSRLFALLMATVSVAVLLPATTQPAIAQQKTASVQHSIPAGPLPQALNRFADVSGLQLVYDAGVTSKLRTKGFNGKGTNTEILSALLSGTGLIWRSTGANSVTIESPSVAANAEGVVLADDGSINLNTITVSNGGILGSHADTYQTAGSVNYISAQEVEQKRGTSVGDFISGIPGVLNGDSRNSGALDVNIRGLQGQGRVPVVIDGASQEQTVYRGYNGARSGSFVDPDFISEVSIEKGASGAADANGAIGGVVRMTTLGVHDILLPDRQFGVRVRGGFNTNSTSAPAVMTEGGMKGGWYQPGTQPNLRDGGNMDRPSFLNPTGGNGSVAAAFSSDFVDFVAAYAKRKNGNYFSGKHGSGQPYFVDKSTDPDFPNIGFDGLSPWKGGEEILNTSMENESLLFKGNFQLGIDHALELSFMRYTSEFGEIMPTRIGTHTSAIGVFQSEPDTLDLKTYNARYRWSPESDLIDLKINAFRTDMDHRATNLLPGWGGVVSTSVNYAQTIRNGINVSNESLIEAVPGEFRLEYGGGWQHETLGLPKDIDDKQWVINHSEFPPRSGKRTEKNVFMNGKWEINPQWKAAAGIRYSSFRTSDDNNSMKMIGNWPNFEYELIPGKVTHVSGHGISNHASLNWEPLDDLQLYGRYSDTVRMPSIFETLKGFSTAYLPAGLEPEKARSFEFGVNKTFEDLTGNSDQFRVHAAYYNNHIKNYLTRSNVIYDEPIAGYVGGLGMINLDYAKMAGIELSADYQIGNFTARLGWNHTITSRFCANPGTLWQQEALCSEGGFANSYALQHVPPKDTVTLELGYKMFDDRLMLGTRVSHYSHRFTESTTATQNEIQPGKWKPYTLVDVFGSYNFNEATRLDFAIDNLTDRYYMDALNAALMPAPGRTFRLNMTAKF